MRISNHAFVSKTVPFTCLLLLSLAASSGAEEKPDTQSRLVHVGGNPKLLRYAVRDGSVSAPRLTAIESLYHEYFVILVDTPPHYEKDAVAHAQRMAKWFQENITRIEGEIPVVIYPTKNGVGYSYYISGLSYTHEDYSPKGVMHPQQAIDARHNVISSYYNSMLMRERGQFDIAEKALTFNGKIKR